MRTTLDLLAPRPAVSADSSLRKLYGGGFESAKEASVIASSKKYFVKTSVGGEKPIFVRLGFEQTTRAIHTLFPIVFVYTDYFKRRVKDLYAV